MAESSEEYTHKFDSDTRERGEKTDNYYQRKLEDSKKNPLAQHGSGPMKKVVKPEEMPWEDSPQGRIKHVLNEDLSEELNLPVHGTNIYLQEIPPGSKSGKHRHMSEELIYVIDGSGFDKHWDPTAVIRDETYKWDYPEEPIEVEWRAGDVIYVPTNTVHQHYNASDKESTWLLCCQARVYTHLGYGFEDLEQFENAPEYTPE